MSCSDEHGCERSRTTLVNADYGGLDMCTELDDSVLNGQRNFLSRGLERNKISFPKMFIVNFIFIGC